MKTQPTLYGGRGHVYIGEGGSLGAAAGTDPNDAYIWDRGGAKGLTYRNYGFWATDAGPVDVYNEPELLKSTDRSYAGFNMGISDQARFAEWHKEFTTFEKSGETPSMQIIKFPRPARRPPPRWSPTATGRSAGSSMPSPTRSSGRTPPSSSSRTTPRTAPTGLLNMAIRQSVRGAGSPMPAPKH